MEAKAVLSSGFQLEEDGQHDKMFHTRVIVLDRACALTIDHQSSINAASIEMVDKLELSTTPLPLPYMLSWKSDQSAISSGKFIFSGLMRCNSYTDGFLSFVVGRAMD
jgi:hypothetical protein